MGQMNHQLTRDFEQAVSEYTGAPYVAAVNSCTMALFLALKWYAEKTDSTGIYIPRKTYVSVAQVIQQNAFEIRFESIDWHGSYQLKPLPIWDCARRFHRRMYWPGQIQCVSFHATKILGVDNEQGGAILCDDKDAYEYFKRARLDGRTEGVLATDDTFIRGWHCYMSPRVAQLLHQKLKMLPDINEDLPNDDYTDLSQQEIFK